MTKTEAAQQIEAFFRRLGEKASFPKGKNFVRARIGEAVVGFEYEEATGHLSAQALVYRFRGEPRDEVLDAVFAQETETNSGGGRVVFNSENLAFYLQKDYDEVTGDEQFYESVNVLAIASTEWNAEILTRAAETARA